MFMAPFLQTCLDLGKNVPRDSPLTLNEQLSTSVVERFWVKCMAQSTAVRNWVITEVWHMAHFWVSYGRCTMPGSPMGRSEGLSRRWTG